MSPTNGEGKIKARDLTFSDRLDLLLQAIAEVQETQEELIQEVSELKEKVGNISLESDGYQVTRYDS